MGWKKKKSSNLTRVICFISPLCAPLHWTVTSCQWHYDFIRLWTICLSESMTFLYSLCCCPPFSNTHDQALVYNIKQNYKIHATQHNAIWYDLMWYTIYYSQMQWRTIWYNLIRCTVNEICFERCEISITAFTKKQTMCKITPYRLDLPVNLI